MTQDFDWAVFQRQPKSAFLLVLFSSFTKIAKGIWPFILLMLFSKKQENGFTIYLVTLVPLFALFFSVLRFFFFRFSVLDNQLLVKEGILKKNNLVLPFNKIQAVHLNQNWLHQMLDMAEVSFDSPGSDEAEVKIILGKPEAEALKEYISGAGINAVDQPGILRERIVKLTTQDLFKLGISANHLETLAIMIGLVISFFNNIKELVEDQFEELFNQSASTLMNSGIAFVIYFILLVLLISIVVSFLRIVMNYANFSVFKTEAAFSVSSGLINTREKVIPFKKIQFISWKTNLIRKKIPIYLFEFHSIGGPTTDEKLKIKIPVTNISLLNKLAEVYHPIPETDRPFILISKNYIFRTTLIQGILPFLIIAPAVFFYFNLSSALATLILPAYVLFSSYLFCLKFRLSYDSEIIQLNKGILGINSLILRWKNIQSVTIQQSLYQQSHKLASVSLSTAGGTIQVPFITLEDAQYLQNYSLYKIESSPETWM